MRIQVHRGRHAFPHGFRSLVHVGEIQDLASISGPRGSMRRARGVVRDSHRGSAIGCLGQQDHEALYRLLLSRSSQLAR